MLTYIGPIKKKICVYFTFE